MTIRHHLYSQWLSVVGQQAITSTNVDQDRHKPSLGHTKLMFGCALICVIQDVVRSELSLHRSHNSENRHRVSNALRWRHNERDSVSNHQPHHCLLNRSFRRRSKKTPKLRVTGLCAGKSPGTSEFPAQMASNAENVSIWWHHHGGANSGLIETITQKIGTEWPMKAVSFHDANNGGFDDCDLHAWNTSSIVVCVRVYDTRSSLKWYISGNV